MRNFYRHHRVLFAHRFSPFSTILFRILFIYLDVDNLTERRLCYLSGRHPQRRSVVSLGEAAVHICQVYYAIEAMLRGILKHGSEVCAASALRSTELEPCALAHLDLLTLYSGIAHDDRVRDWYPDYLSDELLKLHVTHRP